VGNLPVVRLDRLRAVSHIKSGGEEEEANLMVSTLSFIQANLQHSIAASRVLTRTVSGK
jgi:hypothetical protein